MCRVIGANMACLANGMFHSSTPRSRTKKFTCAQLTHHRHHPHHATFRRRFYNPQMLRSAARLGSSRHALYPFSYTSLCAQCSLRTFSSATPLLSKKKVSRSRF